MEKQFLILIAFLVADLPAIAQGLDFEWVKQLGGEGDELSASITVDKDGNIYTTGYITATADFDPDSLGVFNLDPVGINDIFISKLDPSGNFAWAKQIGGPGQDAGNAVAVDPWGNVYVTGSFQDTVDFDPDAAAVYPLVSVGKRDIFILKLDSAGHLVWVIQLGGTGEDYGYGIAVDPSGCVYTAGSFRETVDFDPDLVGTYPLISLGNDDAFITKMDPSGNLIWAKQFSGPKSDVANAVTVDSSGNIYTTGAFHETADFDPAPDTTYSLTAAWDFNDVFVSKLNSQGTFVWAISFGGLDGDGGKSVSVDNSGNVLVTGSFGGTVDFDPDPIGEFNLTQVGGHDIFISKLDANGNFCWARGFGGHAQDAGKSVVTDNLGNVYTIGYFLDTIDFDPDPTEEFYLVPPSGSYDVFISKLDSSGTFVWAKRMGGIGSDSGAAIFVDASGGIYSTGNFQETADFDSGSANLVSAGLFDIYVHKMQCVVNTSFSINGSLEKIIVVYPNPTKGPLEIVGLEGDGVKIRVSDLMGNVLVDYKPFNHHIDLSGLHEGLYMVSLWVGNQMVVKKVVKE